VRGVADYAIGRAFARPLANPPYAMHAYLMRVGLDSKTCREDFKVQVLTGVQWRSPMDRRAFLGLAIAGAASPLLGRVADAQPVMNAKTIEVKSSHLSLISHPDTIANLILEAAGQG
jgi:hypothetical protein